jgi:hypothetical protein
METKYFKVKVKHDKGSQIIVTSASDDVQCSMLIQAAECCPKSAIVYIKEVSYKQFRKILGW